MRATASADRERQVLELWEHSVGLDRWQRDEALLACDGAAPRGLGARNLALLGLRNALFDRRWTLRSACPACAAECEFEIDSIALAERLGGRQAPQSATVDWAGRSLAVRAPTVDDLIAISRESDSDGAVRALLARCIDGADDLAIDDAAMAALERRMEELDPAAAISFQLRCVSCAHEWASPLDVGDAVSVELRRAAERTLTEVAALAGAYGWTETEVMRLTPIRRAAYLQLVRGA